MNGCGGAQGGSLTSSAGASTRTSLQTQTYTKRPDLWLTRGYNGCEWCVGGRAAILARRSDIALVIAATGVIAWVGWEVALEFAPFAGEAVPVAGEFLHEAAHDAGSSAPIAGEQDDSPLSLAPRIGEIVPRATRNVTPPGITPGPPITGPLVRVPSPVPPKPRKKPPARKQRLFNSEVASAGLLMTKAGAVAIANIEAPTIEDSCGTGSESWPCGMVARTQLRRFIRGRAVECEIPPGADELPEAARCAVAGQDVGDWLVRQGWAFPSGSTYSQSGKVAQAAKRGLWGTGRASNSVCFSNC